MKKVKKMLPLGVIVAAAFLRLSIDSQGELSFRGEGDQSELYRNSDDEIYKLIIDLSEDEEHASQD